MFTATYTSNGRAKIVSLAIILLTLTSCGARRVVVSHCKTSTTLQDDIIRYGKQYLGKPYRYAAKGPNSFDCSGYTSFVFQKFGYRLSSSSSGQDKQIPSIARREELRKGDLVFFEGNRKNGRVGHVGIVTETFSNGQFKFIHSSTTSGVIISSSTEPYYASRYLRGGRVLEENASYVTRQNQQSNKKQPSILYSASANKESSQPDTMGITLRETTKYVVISTQTEEHSGNEKNESVVLVQTDPQKNPPLADHREATREKEPKKNTFRTKSCMVLRDEDNLITPTPSQIHTVQMGETLYSISKQYGCTVELLKEWNPQMGSLLRTGEKLRIFPR